MVSAGARMIFTITFITANAVIVLTIVATPIRVARGRLRWLGSRVRGSAMRGFWQPTSEGRRPTHDEHPDHHRGLRGRRPGRSVLAGRAGVGARARARRVRRVPGEPLRRPEPPVPARPRAEDGQEPDSPRPG